MSIFEPTPAANLPALSGNTIYWTYEGLLSTMGDGPSWSQDDDDYQGDTFAIVTQGEHYGFIVFGWGSCSGCDALEAAHGDIVMATDLRDEIYHSARWFSSLEDFLTWEKSERTTANQWYVNKDSYRKLIAEIRIEVAANTKEGSDV